MGVVRLRRLMAVVLGEGRDTPSLASWGQRNTKAVEFVGRLVVVAHAAMERTAYRSLFNRSVLNLHPCAFGVNYS